LVNTVRGLAKAAGARVRSCDTDHFGVAARETLPSELVAALEPILKTIEELTKRVLEQDKAVEALAKDLPDARRLDQVYAVGALTAVTYIFTLDDKARFKSSRSVGPYVGLCPKQDQSGDTDKQLHITKAGDAQLRTLLIGCAQTILRKNAPDSDLKRWGTKLASRGGKNAKRRAVVAVARKLAVLLHRLWVTGEEYEPLRSSKGKAA
jgi:transposase